jgi:hypothetical protein
VLSAILSCVLVTPTFGQQLSRIRHVDFAASREALDARELSQPLAAPRRKTAPAVASAFGGLLSGTVALVGLLAATWDNPEGVPEPLIWGGFGLGTAAGAAAATAIWENPNRGLLVGALVGAAPMLLAATSNDDDTAGMAIVVAWIGAPLGAAIGQKLGRP